MKVAIDVSALHYSRRGVSRYIRNVVSALRGLPGNPVEIREIGFRVDNFGYRQPWRAFKTALREFVWQPVVAPLAIQLAGAEVFHSTCNPCVNPPRRTPKVVTLHDLEMFHTPDRFRWWTRQRFPWEVEAYRKAERLICVSQATADDAMKFLGVPASRLHVVHLGSRFGEHSPETRPELPLPAEYFLFVSAIEPGKNLRLLNDTYRLAASRGIFLPPLLIVGERVEGVAHEGTAPADWTYVGRCSDEHLVYLYRRSLALLAPTRYEGFGLPILEAMALGTAVICSRLSSLPEVGGEVPLYADQTPEAYLREMRRLLEDPEIRRERVAAGLLQASHFSWERCAEQTLEVYRSLRH